MGYQELISSYENKGLDTTSLKNLLETAKPLKGRLKYRAIEIVDKKSALLNEINNILIISEIPDRVDVFEENLNNTLDKYFLTLINSIKSVKAWKFMKLNTVEYKIDDFKQLKTKEKFEKIFFLNEKYLDFLKYQNIADIRDCLENANELSDETIERLEFLRQMFIGFKNREIKVDFFCFDKAFLLALIDFRNSRSFKLEDYIKTKRKKSKKEYKRLLQFFTNEDFRDIAENIDLARRTLKVPANTIMEAYSELSESEAESYYIEEEFNGFKKLEEKYNKMEKVKVEYGKIKTKLERLEKKSLKQNALEKHKEKVIVSKERVNPLILSWLERENITLTKKVGSKNLVNFFDKIKEIEKTTGIRESLYIISNAGKETTLKRFKDFRKKAIQNGLPNLVEGALGGYSSFRIDKDETIIDIAEMPKKNREDIIKILDKMKDSILKKDLIDISEDCYIRYDFSKQKDVKVTKKYLNVAINKALKNEKISKMPLKFLTFMENKAIGIDVLYEEQIKGISQISEYYNEKYLINPRMIMQTRIDDIDKFID